MGFFDDLDENNWKDVPDDPEFVPPNTYRFIISSVREVENEEKGTESLAVQYDIWQGKYEGQSATEWFTIKDPSLTDDQLSMRLSYLKRRLNSLQVHIGDFKETRGQCIIGMKVTAEIKNNTKGERTYRNIVQNSVKLDTGDTSTGSVFDF